MKRTENAGDSSSLERAGNSVPGTTSHQAGSRKPGKRKRLWRFLLALFLIHLAVACYQIWKPLPENLSLEGEVCQVPGSDIEFVFDVTGNKDGQRVLQQAIFDRTLGLIREAQDFVLVDFFLFNGYLGKDSNVHRRLCEEVSTALLHKKLNRPNIRMVVITDPINEVYGGAVLENFRKLREAGIPVVATDLRRLRDSNPVYSSFWRMFVQWFGNSIGGSLPHPFAKDAGKVSLRSWLALLNFKANHRKLLVADAPASTGGRQMVSMVMSANPHDASSAHNNVALFVRGGVWKDLLRSEQAILTFSGQKIDLFSLVPSYATNTTTANSNADQIQKATVQVVTESKIRTSLLEVIGSVRTGDTVDIGMFYLSERSIINALLDAARKGAVIRLLLDPNRDAFGYEKNGIPNRPVGAELIKGTGGKISIRWYNTHGEQFHTKMVIVKQPNRATLFAGSANFTRRNIGDFNLETDLVVTGAHELPAIQTAQAYFNRLWANQDLDYSVPYETYAEPSASKYLQYRLQERSGASTF